MSSDKRIKNSNLTDSEIESLIKDFEEIKKIESLEKGDEIIYFSKGSGNNKMIFRKGGYIKVIDTNKNYLILTNAGKNWSVQYKDNIIYRRSPKEMIAKNYEEKIKKKDEEIKELKNALKKLYKENESLKKK